MRDDTNGFEVGEEHSENTTTTGYLVSHERLARDVSKFVFFYNESQSAYCTFQVDNLGGVHCLKFL